MKDFSLRKKLLLGLLVLIILTPLGIIAEGTAFGEWSSLQIKDLVGYIPEGLLKFESFFHALLPDYTIKGFESGGKLYLGYLLSAVIGVFAVTLTAFGISKFLSKHEGKDIEEK